MSSQFRNIGIFAHADAGKTSIIEHLLYLAGDTKVIGNVDDGTSVTDYLQVEKKRGISVKSSLINFDYEGVHFNIIDTPGHVDFSSEVERSLRVIDSAILVISAVEGIQAQTETIWNVLIKYNVPVVFFINKIDRAGADPDYVLNCIMKHFTKSIAVLNNPVDNSRSEGDVYSIWNADNLNSKALENLAEFNDDILENFLNDEEILFESADNELKKQILETNIFPVVFGSAKYSTGIDQLADVIIKYLPAPVISGKEEFSALIFALTHQKTSGKIAFARIYGGVIKNRDTVKIFPNSIEEKITHVKKIYAGEYRDKQFAEAGDIVALFGLKNVKVGDILGDPGNLSHKKFILQSPLLTISVIPENDDEFHQLIFALKELTEEDPNLNFKWFKEEKELYINVSGKIQTEILQTILSDKYGISVKFSEPTVIYKETPSKTGEGFIQYWMPKPCWAILKFKIEPGLQGSGVIYTSTVSVDKIHQKYQNEVERTVSKALEQGIKGWEVTDIKITLTDGEDHEIHSRPGDFVVAAPMGIMNGLANTGTTFLEPVLSFKINAPEKFLGSITSDITKMRGTFESPEFEDDYFYLSGILPLATSLDYSVKLNSTTAGKAKISYRFHSYQKCKDEYGKIRKFKGISPLDTAKYILKARKAIQ